MTKAAKSTPRKARKVAKKATHRNGVDAFGFRTGSLKSKAAALYASGNGATLSEIKAKLKSSQFNLLTELKAKKFKIKRTLVPGVGARKATRYQVLQK